MQLSRVEYPNSLTAIEWEHSEGRRVLSALRVFLDLIQCTDGSLCDGSDSMRFNEIGTFKLIECYTIQ